MSTTEAPIQFLSHLLPEPLSAEVTLALCPVDQNHPIEILSTAEQTEWESFDSTSRRREYVSTRWLISQMVQELDINPSDFRLQKDHFGKPYGMYGGEGYHVSIAHTDEQVLCGISPRQAIGVDIEPRERRIPNKLRKRILHAHEKDRLKDEPTVRIWTIKEAMVKLMGKGMRINLNECIIDSTAQNDTFLGKFGNEKTAKICSFSYDNNWLAVARKY